VGRYTLGQKAEVPAQGWCSTIEFR
jgi:hypothetical protein